MIFFFDKFETNLNLLIPKKLLFFLKIDETNISLTPCFSLVLISCKLCADPTSKKSFLKV